MDVSQENQPNYYLNELLYQGKVGELLNKSRLHCT